MSLELTSQRINGIEVVRPEVAPIDGVLTADFSDPDVLEFWIWNNNERVPSEVFVVKP